MLYRELFYLENISVCRKINIIFNVEKQLAYPSENYEIKETTTRLGTN